MRAHERAYVSALGCNFQGCTAAAAALWRQRVAEDGRPATRGYARYVSSKPFGWVPKAGVRT